MTGQTSVSGQVTLAHGSGGRASRELLRTVIESSFGHAVTQHDSAVVAGSDSLAITTDTFVVSPRHFPGGDIGRLAVFGTVNDLAVAGADPRYLTCGLVLEEGLELSELAGICSSMATAAAEAGVDIVAGDTKVVARGQADGMYINTAGVGFVDDRVHLGFEEIRPGDVVLVSGDVGRHGACVAGMRQDFGLSHDIHSDCAPLAQLCWVMLEAGTVRYMRDATRGGLGAVVTELALASGTRFQLVEDDIPVQGAVRAVCELLGLSPLHLACEGRLVAVVAEPDADAILAAMRSIDVGSGSCRIGVVREGDEPPVTLLTYLGVETVLSLPAGELLPRIC